MSGVGYVKGKLKQSNSNKFNVDKVEKYFIKARKVCVLYFVLLINILVFELIDNRLIFL